MNNGGFDKPFNQLKALSDIARREMQTAEVTDEQRDRFIDKTIAAGSMDITSQVHIQREIREDAEMKLPPHDRVKQIAWLMKRLTWIQLEDFANQIQDKLPYERGPNMARALIEWAQEVDK